MVKQLYFNGILILVWNLLSEIQNFSVNPIYPNPKTQSYEG